MDLMKTEYEFLDLTDVKETELSSLQCALFQPQPDKLIKARRSDFSDPNLEWWSKPGANVSGRLEAGGEEMAANRAPPPPPYAAPPPYQQQWPTTPNVYVSQVTANVNVHGYPYYSNYDNRTRPRRPSRGKRSPPPQPPPYYVQYPPYYQPAQGTPLYHMPVYQPVTYVGHYPYPYYQEYTPDGEEKPEEYPPELLAEQEPVDYYYPYPPAEPDYFPYLPQHHPHQPVPHQFNVHAKNFVANQYHNKPYSPPDKNLPLSPPIPSTSNPNIPPEALPMKDLKIKPSPPIEQLENNQPKPSTSQEKTSPVPKIEAPKPWVPPEVKVSEQTPVQTPAKTFTTNAPIPSTSQGSKPTPPVVKKTPAAPFSGKPKPLLPPAAVVQQNVSIPKAPFGNRQKREERPIEEKRSPPLPASKAPMPISITLHSAGPLIVTNKSPFSQTRKPQPEPAPAPPTASDFPPPPTPRCRGEPQPAPAPQPPPAPGKSWASLFSNKAIGSSPLPNEEVVNPPNVKPVAKVQPFDASPSTTEKVKVNPVGISYSEKTSANTASNNVTPAKSVSPTIEVKDVPIQKESPAVPVQPSPFADDPNSFRMGEFLSKYQLEHRPVMLLPRGLTNRSNYCYVNAILQALIACPPFYNMLKALPYQTRRGKSSTPVIDAMVELCYEFTPLSAAARVSRARGTESAAGALPIQTGPPLDPSAGQKVLRALRPFPGSQEGRQEDAEEFLSCLLNGLNDEMLELIKLVEPEEAKEGQTNGVVVPEPVVVEDDDDDWKVMGPRNKGAVERRWPTGRTPLADIFRGRTRCRTHRPPTHDVTDAVQPFFTLQLDIERANNVKDALELLAGKDTLEGVSDAWQQLSIEQPPVVLLLHLKCFQLDADGHTAKIVKNIDFPIELKIDPKVMSQKAKVTPKQRLYKLFAVVYHDGIEAVKGHYLTDTFHGQAGWIRYDDSTVTLVSESQVLKPKSSKMPYLLMYRRQDMIPPVHRPTTKQE